ncbi:hypothetical protein L218DRAFT_658246 [Marasmius fiardii PR-910]|nr:hypothetical protein L218DRAFT_658246 [Marasmius fiardii PR-910]
MPPEGTCSIPANPDIGGIGVRLAIYAQTLLAFCQASTMIKASACELDEGRQRKLSSSEPASFIQWLFAFPTQHFNKKRSNQFFNNSQFDAGVVEQLEGSIFVVGLSVIISAIIQAQSSTGLTTYHTLIVLNISLISNLAGLVIWMTRPDMDSIMFILFKEDHPRWHDRLSKAKEVVARNFWRIAHHLLLSASGLYFWSTQDASLANQPPCLPPTYYWILGLKLPIPFPLLRVYSLILFPFFMFPSYALATVLLVMVSPITTLTLIANIVATASRTMFQSLAGRFPSIRRAIDCLSSPFIWLEKRCKTLSQRLSSPASSSYIVLIACTTFILYMITSTEMTIKINQVAEGENDWSYGQTLALFNALFMIVTFWWRPGGSSDSRRPNDIRTRSGGSQKQ